MSEYLDIKLPNYIATDLISSTSFNTKLIFAHDGQEERYSLRCGGRKQYLLQKCKITFKQLQEFHCFFQECQGKKYGFRMIDYFDYVLSDHVIGIGNGETVEFQIRNKSLDNITHIIPGSTTITIGNNIIVPTVYHKKGIIQLNEALPLNEELKASVKFETICRFDQDSFDYRQDDDGTFCLSDIKIIEILL